MVSEHAQPPPGLLSLAQWDALEPDRTQHWELSEGALIMSPRARPTHQRFLIRLIRLMDQNLPDGFAVLPAIEVTTRASFPPSVRVPDIVVVVESLFDQDPARASAADVVLVVEIVSPSSRGTDHVTKLHEYARAGIEHYWIVDPEAAPADRFVVYRLDGGAYRRVAVFDGQRFHVDTPLEMEFTASALFDR